MKTQFINPTRLQVTGKNLVIESTDTGVIVSEPTGENTAPAAPRKTRGPAKPKNPEAPAGTMFDPTKL